MNPNFCASDSSSLKWGSETCPVSPGENHIKYFQTVQYSTWNGTLKINAFQGTQREFSAITFVNRCILEFCAHYKKFLLQPSRRDSFNLSRLAQAKTLLSKLDRKCYGKMLFGYSGILDQLCTILHYRLTKRTCVTKLMKLFQYQRGLSFSWWLRLVFILSYQFDLL